MNHSLIKFNYEVKIGTTSAFINAIRIEKQFDRIEEMVIYSKPFNSFSECQSGLTNVMAFLSKSESRITKNHHIIVSQSNPLLDTSEKISKEIADDWGKFTLLRQYVADSQKLKKESKLSYHTLGEIKSDHDIQLSGQLQY